MRVLDLYCAAGGAAMGYHQAGFEVVGVDINRQPNYPFEFHQDDALTYPLDGFDLIHASPPCQLYTRKEASWGRPRTYFYEHPDLLGPTKERLIESGNPWIIENVVGAPMESQLLLCGTMLGLRIIKHRIFEANWKLPLQPSNCDHSDVYNPWYGKGRSAAKHREAQGTPWIPQSGGASRKKGVTGDVFNALPPAYTKYIGEHFLKGDMND